jgi:hypothetical protein
MAEALSFPPLSKEPRHAKPTAWANQLSGDQLAKGFWFFSTEKNEERIFFFEKKKQKTFLC